MYMAGALRQANIAQAAREALHRARTAGSLSSSTGEENEDEDEPVDGETDLEEFRRWLDEQPRGSQEDVAPAPSGPNHAPSAGTRAEAPSHVEAPAEPVHCIPARS